MTLTDDLPIIGGFEVDVLPPFQNKPFYCPWWLYFCFDSWSVIVSPLRVMSNGYEERIVENSTEILPSHSYFHTASKESKLNSYWILRIVVILVKSI
jgi:hypothetical protein